MVAPAGSGTALGCLLNWQHLFLALYITEGYIFSIASQPPLGPAVRQRNRQTVLEMASLVKRKLPRPGPQKLLPAKGIALSSRMC